MRRSRQPRPPHGTPSRLRKAAAADADTAAQAQQAVTTATEQDATLATVTIPHDLGELTSALTGLRTRHTELDAETDAADNAYRAAQTALESAPAKPRSAPASEPHGAGRQPER